MFISILVLFVTSFMTTRQPVTSADDSSQKLMLILLDGFRWDYVEKFDLPHFKRFYNRGVRAESVTNDFPTLSLPNYYSISTGLHAESHGITGNFMYDVITKETFELGLNPDHYSHHWWKDGWPIWVTLERMGKTVYAYYWRGAEVVIHGTKAKHVTPYEKPTTNEEFQEATKRGLDVLRDGLADLVAIYHERPDKYGHVYGPDSSQLEMTLKEIDGIMGNLLDGIEGQTDEDKINLMVVSDHGMTSITRSKVINISPVLTPDLYESIQEDGAITNIHLRDFSQQDKVFNLLVDFHPKMTVYKKRDIPEEWHYKYGRYVPMVVCVADIGWFISQPMSTDFYIDKSTGRDMKASHGYKNVEKDMRGIFYAIGPYFKTGSSVESIHVVDLYNVMCGILGITPQPNNGTIQNMAPLLKTFSSDLRLEL